MSVMVVAVVVVETKDGVPDQTQYLLLLLLLIGKMPGVHKSPSLYLWFLLLFFFIYMFF